MKLTTINTGSKGNCYLLTTETGKTLILEAGVKFSEIKKALDFDLSKVVACVCSHEHMDHMYSIDELHESGIPIIANEKVYQRSGLKIDYEITNRFNKFEQIEVGGFTIVPFPVIHDVLTHGFLINHHECGNVLFVTDTADLNYNFPNLNNIIIEANYSEHILSLKSRNEASLYVDERVRKTHFSIEKCLTFLKKTDLRNVNNIVLIHLSERNSDTNRFKRQTREATGKIVTISEPGQTIYFNKDLI